MNTSHARILVPVDYSDDSRVAAATAFRLAAPEGDVALVHVSPRPANDVVDEVCARAVDWPADMIVVGTHCEPGSVRFLLGSDTGE
jgi:nucleotide-binding universal stress UspA family protein